MRMLASIGVLSQEDRNFALSPIGELLRQDTPGSLRNMAIMFVDPWIVNAYLNLGEAVRDGRDGVTHAYGKHAWDLFPEIPDQAHRFQLAMTDFTASLLGPFMEAYDFSTAAELDALLRSAGLRMERIIPTKSPMSVIEARLV